MIKKILLSVLIFFSLNAISQVIVSTSPEKRNVILEEFTGLHCGYCPDGHFISQNIQTANPGDVFLVNIHEGGFSIPSGGEPDFRTQFGTPIANEAFGGGQHSFPSGSVNRHVFTGQSTAAMSRSQWNSKSNEVLNEVSYVNVAVEADIDVQTNEITIHVEVYYTGNSPESTNLLNVALLQNNTLGWQTDYGNSPDGNTNQYNHMHRLVHMITGTWGESISPTTTGTFIDKTYTYTIPADYNDIPVEIADLEIVAFISETHQEIPSGSGCFPTFSNFEFANDATLKTIIEIDDQCGFDIAPKVTLENVGEDNVTSVELTYSVNGGDSETYTWNGLLTSLQKETIELPEISYTIDAVNTLTVSLEDDENNSNNTSTANFDNAIETTSTANMILNTGNSGAQCTWTITNFAGDTVYSGGPYGNNQNIQETFSLPIECYEFHIMNSTGNSSGSILVRDSDNNVIFINNGSYGYGASSYFTTNGTLSSSDQVLTNIAMYPNPTNSILNIENAENSTIEIYDLLGRLILTRSNISLHEKIDVSNLNAGTYLIRFKNESIIATDKFIISK